MRVSFGTTVRLFPCDIEVMAGSNPENNLFAK